MHDRQSKGRRLVTYGKSNRNNSQPYKSKPSDSSIFPTPLSGCEESERVLTPISTEKRKLQQQQQQQQQQQEEVVEGRGGGEFKEQDTLTSYTHLPGMQSSQNPHDGTTHYAPSRNEMEVYRTVKSKRRKLVSDQKRHLANVSIMRDAQLSPDPKTMPKLAYAKSYSAPWENCPQESSLGGDKSKSEYSDSAPQSSQSTDKKHEEATSTRKRLVDSLSGTQKSVHGLPSAFATGNEANFTSCHQANDLSHTHRKPTLLRDTATPNASSAQEPAASVPSDLRPSKITYARQRSFLNDISTCAVLEDQDQSAYKGKHPSKQPPLVKMVPHSSTNIDDNEDNDSGSVRSIHELRQAGDNARFRGAVDSMFEDIEDIDNPVSSRCSCLMQLCTKLLDPKYARRFSEQGFEKRLLESINNDMDSVTTSLALCTCDIISSNCSLPSTFLMSLWSKILIVSPRLLGFSDDLLLLARHKFRSSKTTLETAERLISQMLSDFCGEVKSSDVSPCLLALRCIQSTLSKFQKGDAIEPISATILDKLVELLVLGSPAEAVDFSLSAPEFQTLTSTLSILESYTVLSGTLADDYHESLRTLTQVSKFLELKWYGFHDRRRQILTLYIRVILNITNNDPSLCEVFSTPELIGGLVKIITREFRNESEDSFTEENNFLNTVILALGALINLTEKSELSRTVFLDSTSYSPTLLHLLLRLFSASVGVVRKADSILEVHHNVAIGYLSTLLITICLDTEARSQVKKFLDGKGLQKVMSTANEFLHYHQRVEQDAPAFNTGNDKMTGFTMRLKDIICQINEHEIST